MRNLRPDLIERCLNSEEVTALAVVTTLLHCGGRYVLDGEHIEFDSYKPLKWEVVKQEGVYLESCATLWGVGYLLT